MMQSPGAVSVCKQIAAWCPQLLHCKRQLWRAVYMPTASKIARFVGVLPCPCLVPYSPTVEQHKGVCWLSCLPAPT